MVGWSCFVIEWYWALCAHTAGTSPSLHILFFVSFELQLSAAACGPTLSIIRGGPIQLFWLLRSVLLNLKCCKVKLKLMKKTVAAGLDERDGLSRVEPL